MARSRFKTKLSKRQRRKSILVFLLVGVLSYLFVLAFGFALELFDGLTWVEILTLSLALAFFVLSMLLFPVLISAIVLGLQKGSAKRVRDDSSFVATQDIMYYRDTLEGLDPSLVSILIDLDLYGKKDVAATLLRLKNKKVVDFDEQGKVVIQNRDAQILSGSERELLFMLDAGQINNKNSLARWKQNRFRDAECCGYLVQKPLDKGKLGAYVIIALLSLGAVFVLWGLFLNLNLFEFDEISGMLVSLGSLAVIDVFLFVPFYLLAKKAAYYKRCDVLWERTPLGNEMAEKIAGLGRFIHDFSLMSEADKEAVVVWDDYLVYAIVLEENNRIVEDISKYYHFSLHRFDQEGLLQF